MSRLSERYRKALAIHRERGCPPGYEGPCWGPTHRDYDELDRRIEDGGEHA